MKTYRIYLSLDIYLDVDADCFWVDPDTATLFFELNNEIIAAFNEKAWYAVEERYL